MSQQLAEAEVGLSVVNFGDGAKNSLADKDGGFDGQRKACEFSSRVPPSPKLTERLTVSERRRAKRITELSKACESLEANGAEEADSME